MLAIDRSIAKDEDAVLISTIPRIENVLLVGVAFTVGYTCLLHVNPFGIQPRLLGHFQAFNIYDCKSQALRSEYYTTDSKF